MKRRNERQTEQWVRIDGIHPEPRELSKSGTRVLGQRYDNTPDPVYSPCTDPIYHNVDPDVRLPRRCLVH